MNDTFKRCPSSLMKLPALRRQLAQQMGEVNQVLGDQVADFALASFARITACISALPDSSASVTTTPLTVNWD